MQSDELTVEVCSKCNRIYRIKADEVDVVDKGDVMKHGNVASFIWYMSSRSLEIRKVFNNATYDKPSRLIKWRNFLEEHRVD